MNTLFLETITEDKRKKSYFFNGLFSVLYHQVKDKYSVSQLVNLSHEPNLHIARSAFYQYLNCEVILTQEHFEEFCKYLNISLNSFTVRDYRIALKYAIDFEDNIKLTFKEWWEKIAFEVYNDDFEYTELQYIEKNEELTQIMINKLDDDEVLRLNRMIPLWKYITNFECDLLIEYLNFTAKAKDMFTEYIQSVETEASKRYYDESVIFFQSLLEHGNSCKNDAKSIRNSMLSKFIYGKYELPADVKTLISFLRLKENDWKNLISVHQIMYMDSSDEYYVKYATEIGNMFETFKIIPSCMED